MDKHREVRGTTVSMSEKEVEHLLTTQPLIRLATASKNAEPHVTPLWYVYVDGHIYFSADGKTKKVHNIKENKIVSVLIDSGDELFKVKGAMINGEADIIEDNELIRNIRILFAKKYFGSEDNPEFERLDFYMRKQVFLKIKPIKIVSWDYTRWYKE